MLREDTLQNSQILGAHSVPIPTPEELRAIELAARRMRAQVIRDAFRSAYAWLFRGHDVPAAGKVGVAAGR
jgi:hypothetical protein